MGAHRPVSQNLYTGKPPDGMCRPANAIRHKFDHKYLVYGKQKCKEIPRITIIKI